MMTSLLQSATLLGTSAIIMNRIIITTTNYRGHPSCVCLHLQSRYKMYFFFCRSGLMVVLKYRLRSDTIWLAINQSKGQDYFHTSYIHTVHTLDLFWNCIISWLYNIFVSMYSIFKLYTVYVCMCDWVHSIVSGL